jgi:hypothetical protein
MTQIHQARDAFCEWLCVSNKPAWVQYRCRVRESAWSAIHITKVPMTKAGIEPSPYGFLLLVHMYVYTYRDASLLLTNLARPICLARACPV